MDGYGWVGLLNAPLLRALLCGANKLHRLVSQVDLCDLVRVIGTLGPQFPTLAGLNPEVWS